MKEEDKIKKKENKKTYNFNTYRSDAYKRGKKALSNLRSRN